MSDWLITEVYWTNTYSTYTYRIANKSMYLCTKGPGLLCSDLSMDATKGQR